MKRAVARSTILARRNLRIERPVEGRELLHLRNARLFEAPDEEAIGAPGQLVLDEQIQKVDGRQRGGRRLCDAQRAAPPPSRRVASVAAGS